MKDFFFCKPKRAAVLFRCCCYNFKIIQIGKDRFFTDSCYSCQQSPFHIGIRFECGIEQASDKRCKILPIPMNIRFLQRSIILIQKNNHLFSVIAAQIIGQIIDSYCCRIIRHIFFNGIKIGAVFFIQYFAGFDKFKSTI